MKKPTIFTFHIWNPLKQIKINLELNLVNKDWMQTYIFEFAFVFFQFEIDFKCLYYTMKNL